MRLKGKVALVTGAGSGIGRATAILFSQEGAGVVVVDQNSENGTATKELIDRSGGESIFVPADVSSSEDVKAMLGAAVDRFLRLNILVNNAGIDLRRTVVETTEAEWRRIIDTNLTSVFLVSKYAIPLMQETGGVIVNMSSVAGLVGARLFGAYGVSKAGIISLTRVLALECAPDIRVNCICPGFVDTPMVEARLLSAGGNLSQARKGLVARYPLGRMASPEEIASAALYLASDEASFVTGSVLVIDGGFTAQ